jgi:hypothetical protein
MSLSRIGPGLLCPLRRLLDRLGGFSWLSGGLQLTESIRKYRSKLLLALKGGVPPADLLRALLEFAVPRGYDALEIRHLFPKRLNQPLVSACLVFRLVLTLQCRVSVWSGLVRFE